MAVTRAEAPFPSFTSTWHTTTYADISPKRPELNAASKSVVITGGGSGIGARTVLSFAEAGAKNIAILGRREKNLLDTKASVEAEYPETQVFTYVADVTSAAAVDQAFAAFNASVGAYHILVNNAGLGDIGPVIKDADTDFWMNNLNTNVKGSLFVAQAFLRHAVEDAVMVNVASLASFMPLMGGISAYSVSKAASVTLFSCLQVENPLLRVVNLQPGVVETEMNKRSGMPGLDDASLPADFIVWLASPEASFTKGKYLFVNWDVKELAERAQEISGPGGLLEMWIEGLEHKGGK